MWLVDDLTELVPESLKPKESEMVDAQMDKFLIDISKKRHCDWAIEKKLLEGGGTGNTVYILQARGGGKSIWTHETVEDLSEEGRDVVAVRKYDFKLSGKDVEAIRGYEQQLDLYSKLTRPVAYFDPYKQGMFCDWFPTEEYNLEPSWTIDPYGQLRFRDISIVRKEEKNDR